MTDEQILDAIDRGGGQACNVEGVVRALAEAGYEIVPAGTQAALRPFADGYRKIQRMYSIPHGIGYHNTFTMQDLARAAELVPEATSSPPSSPGSRAT